MADPVTVDRARDDALAYDAWFDAGWGAYTWRVESRAVLTALGPVAGRRVLEVGCGTARLTGLLTERGAEVLGVDVDPGRVAVSADRAPGRVLRADAERLPLSDASADATVTLAVLEFVHDPAAVIAEMVRVTRPGGRVVAACLNPRSLWGVLDRPAQREPYRRGRFLSARELARLGGRYGQVSLTSALFTARRLPRGHTADLLEHLGSRWLPRLGALQVLTVEVPR